MPERNGFYLDRALNFGHRGARERAPENTIPSFLLAAQLGADGIELDVHLTADGVPVVIHDSRVERTTNGSGSVEAMTLAEIRELDAGSSFSDDFVGVNVPTLEEVFEAIGPTLRVNVEIKSFNAFKRSVGRQLATLVANVIQKFGAQERVIASSFNPFVLRDVRRVAPWMPVGYLYAPNLPLPLAKGWLAEPIIGPHEARHPYFKMVDEAYMRWARERGYRVNVWTVNEDVDIRRMLALGVDAIITDRSDVVCRIIQPDETVQKES